jgi:hypothetical protein
MRWKKWVQIFGIDFILSFVYIVMNSDIFYLKSFEVFIGAYSNESYIRNSNAIHDDISYGGIIVL